MIPGTIPSIIRAGHGAITFRADTVTVRTIDAALDHAAEVLGVALGELVVESDLRGDPAVVVMRRAFHVSTDTSA